MNSASERIRGAVSAEILEKVNRLFRNDNAGVWGEILQNARRAGATEVRVQIEPADRECRITVEDDGRGIADFQSLLTLGTSNWTTDVVDAEDPAGIGFFSLCHSTVEVASGRRFVTLTPATFLGQEDAEVLELADSVPGTRIRLTRPSGEPALVTALEGVAEFAPITVVVNGRTLERHDFLDGALYREEIDGIEIGIAHDFRWAGGYFSSNWNFHGLRIRHPFHCPTGLVARDALGNWVNRSLQIRFNVYRMGVVSLQLPDRRAIVENKNFRLFERKVRAAIYRFFAAQEHHVLPFKEWKEAWELGVPLPEAAPLLYRWRARAADESYDSVFGETKRELVTDLSRVLLVPDDLANQHTLNGALAGGSPLQAELFEEERSFEGYKWYSSLLCVGSANVRIDGQDASRFDWKNKYRPERIDVDLTIRRNGEPQRTEALAALVHVDSESYDPTRFVAAVRSPWDDPAGSSPFSMVEFLMTATFVASDNAGEADSWETQQREHREMVERVIQEYFFGRRASVLYLLKHAIPWVAEQYLDDLSINELRFHRVAGSHNWLVDFGESGAPRFTTHTVADVSTGYLEESDLQLLLDRHCPTRLAITDDGGGTFHVVTDDEDLFADEMGHAAEFGLSTRFRLIMERLRAAGLLYVRFDADGGEIDGLERIVSEQ